MPEFALVESCDTRYFIGVGKHAKYRDGALAEEIADSGKPGP